MELNKDETREINLNGTMRLRNGKPVFRVWTPTKGGPIFMTVNSLTGMSLRAKTTGGVCHFVLTDELKTIMETWYSTL